jgi:hypothetical protein
MLAADGVGINLLSPKGEATGDQGLRGAKLGDDLRDSRCFLR